MAERNRFFHCYSYPVSLLHRLVSERWQAASDSPAGSEIIAIPMRPSKKASRLFSSL
jgi:hypothetical protein